MATRMMAARAMGWRRARQRAQSGLASPGVRTRRSRGIGGNGCDPGRATDAVAVEQRDALPEPVPHRAMITVCVIGATILQSLDQTIANVALPYMQGSFSASYDEITWVLTSYITAAAIMTAPVAGWRRGSGASAFFLVCIIGFTIDLDAVRRGAVVAADRAVPAAAGHVQRGAGAAVAGHPARHLPGRAARLRHGDLGHRA